MTLDLPVINCSDGHRNESICRACGGGCCQNGPGLAAPSDFGPPETLQAVLEEYFRTGFWAVDWWEGDTEPGGGLSQVYFVRPAMFHHKGKLRHPAWHSETCILWSPDHGCSLQFQNRPHECRHLKPTELDAKGQRGCRSDMGNEEYSRLWRPFQAELIAAMDAVERCLANSPSVPAAQS